MTLAASNGLISHNVADVVDALATVSSNLPRIMVVGAVCRDALHVLHGHEFSLRSTDDLDLALVVDGLDQFAEITGNFRQVTGSGGAVRYSIADRAVDLVPFGSGVEEPDGVVTPGQSMSVFGFQDVLASARAIVLPNGDEVRVPTTPGYTLLKLKAWADRSAFGEYKDATDLACTMWWYQNDREMVDRLYSTDDGIAQQTMAEWDEEIASVRILMSDAVQLLTDGRRTELREIWTHHAPDDALFASQLSNNRLPGWPARSQHRSDRDRLHDYASAPSLWASRQS